MSLAVSRINFIFEMEFHIKFKSYNNYFSFFVKYNILYYFFRIHYKMYLEWISTYFQKKFEMNPENHP